MATNHIDMCKDALTRCFKLEQEIREFQDILPKAHSFNVFLEEAYRKIRLVDNMAYYVVNEAEGTKQR